MSSYRKLLKCLLLFCAILIFLSCTSSFGQAATYYVTPGGSDYNSGTEAKPWRTVDKAADKMIAGDIVYVKEGTYSGFAVSKSGTANNYISYLAYPGDTPIINGEIWFANGASYNKIDGFILRNSTGGGIEMITGNKYNIISNNIIRDSASCGVDLSENSEGNIIEYNEIYGHREHGIHTSGSTNGDVFNGNIVHDNYLNGLGLAWGTALRIINNIVYNNGKSGIEYTGKDKDGVIEGNICYGNNVRTVGSSEGGWEICASGENFVLRNNTAHSYERGNQTYWIESTGLKHIVRNNIGYRNDSKKVLVLIGSIDEDYNCWYNPQNPIVPKGAHSIALDPKFVDIGNNDYRLRADSPCIGTGENAVDMGAYGYPGLKPRTDAPETVRNRPNPFRAGKEETLIEYNLRQPSNVTITIYDLLGQEVWRKSFKAGGNGGREVNSVPWDGRNLSGETVGNGGYICRIWIERENRHIVRKIGVVK